MAESLSEALAEEVRRVDAEETASATKAERAGDAAAAPVPVQKFEKPGTPAAPPEAPPNSERASAPVSPASPTPANTDVVDDADLVSILEQVGENEVAQLAIVLMDVVVTKRFGEKFALTEKERQRLQRAAIPVVRLYLPDIKVHPLTGFALVAAATYGVKTLPEGALAQALGGASKSAPAGDTPAAPPAAAAAPGAAT